MFGNQVLNVSGSRDDHPGNGVKTICFMAQNTAIIYTRVSAVFGRQNPSWIVGWSPVRENKLFTFHDSRIRALGLDGIV